MAFLISRCRECFFHCCRVFLLLLLTLVKSYSICDEALIYLASFHSSQSQLSSSNRLPILPIDVLTSSNEDGHSSTARDLREPVQRPHQYPLLTSIRSLYQPSSLKKARPHTTPHLLQSTSKHKASTVFSSSAAESKVSSFSAAPARPYSCKTKSAMS